MNVDDGRDLARMQLMLKTTETDGWKEIVNELRNEVESIKGELLTVKTWERTNYLQGRIEQCFNIIFLEDTLGNMIDQLSIVEEQDADV